MVVEFDLIRALAREPGDGFVETPVLSKVCSNLNWIFGPGVPSRENFSACSCIGFEKPCTLSGEVGRCRHLEELAHVKVVPIAVRNPTQEGIARRLDQLLPFNDSLCLAAIRRQTYER